MNARHAGRCIWFSFDRILIRVQENTTSLVFRIVLKFIQILAFLNVTWDRKSTVLSAGGNLILLLIFVFILQVLVFHILRWIVLERDRTITILKQIRIFFILWMLKLNFVDYRVSFRRNFHLFLMFKFLAGGLFVLESLFLHFLFLNVMVRNVYIVWHYVDLVVEIIDILLFFIQLHFFLRRFAGHDVGNFLSLIDLLILVLPNNSHRRLRFVVGFLLCGFLFLSFFLNWLAFNHFLNLFWHGFLILHSVNWRFLHITKWSYE